MLRSSGKRDGVSMHDVEGRKNWDGPDVLRSPFVKKVESVRLSPISRPSRFYSATPFTINMRPFTAARRIGLIAAYAGELYQACACSEVSNTMTTIPLGGASPSRLSVLPPRTTK